MDHRTFLQPQLAVARRYVESHKDTKGCRAAVELVRELLNYHAETTITADVHLQSIFQHLRNAEVNPHEIIARVVAFLLFLDVRPGYFKQQRAEDVALGRLIAHTATIRGKHYTANVYAPAGQRARELLGVFSLQLIRKVTRDAERVQSLRRQSADL